MSKIEVETPSTPEMFAYVRWFDASYQRGECTDEELNAVVVLHSCGILVRETDDHVTLAMDRYDADGTWRYIEHIPKCLIAQIERFDFDLHDFRPVPVVCDHDCGHDHDHDGPRDEFNEPIPQPKITQDEFARLQRELTDEKARRVYYQGIVYAVCTEVDLHDGAKPGQGTVCGTKDEPSEELQHRVRALLSNLRASGARILELERLTYESDQKPQGEQNAHTTDCG